MAPEENAGTELLLQSFERRFLAARTLRSFPWQSLEAKLRDSSDSELLRDILHKVRIPESLGLMTLPPESLRKT
ncbi:EEF2KMT isoform 7 [Pan troglodytes]|uniref:EEF2KMT isoform 5 n=1 Tax=Pan troglodytes TaxID=9598 RepID=A0A2J8LA90_PANTR|nr:EEF2KMT isoform 5 [Pan troglodytes]PNI44194.1 EEF2KMT isoform 7 [Pan troglodytes]